jgi:hypothetical protein
MELLAISTDGMQFGTAVRIAEKGMTVLIEGPVPRSAGRKNPLLHKKSSRKMQANCRFNLLRSAGNPARISGDEYFFHRLHRDN